MFPQQCPPASCYVGLPTNVPCSSCYVCPTPTPSQSYPPPYVQGDWEYNPNLSRPKRSCVICLQLSLQLLTNCFPLCSLLFLELGNTSLPPRHSPLSDCFLECFCLSIFCMWLAPSHPSGLSLNISLLDSFKIDLYKINPTLHHLLSWWL